MWMHAKYPIHKLWKNCAIGLNDTNEQSMAQGGPAPHLCGMLQGGSNIVLLTTCARKILYKSYCYNMLLYSLGNDEKVLRHDIERYLFCFLWNVLFMSSVKKPSL